MTAKPMPPAPPPRPGLLRRSLAALWLAWQFLLAVLLSGWQTLRLILRASAGRPPQPGFLRLRFAPMSPAGATLLGCMICLAPGSTVVEVDLDAGEMRLHLLNRADAGAVLADVRQRFEPALVALFGLEPPR